VEKKTISAEQVNALRDQNRMLETRQILGVIANFMAMPLYMVFWFADLMYVPHLKWEFLVLRMGIIPVGFTIQYLAHKAKNHLEIQRVAFLFNFIMGTAINYMIFRIGDPATGYYAGLNLVALGNLAFIPWQTSYFILTSAVIYVPYFLITGFQVSNHEQLLGLSTNSFFILGTFVIMHATRQFNENLRKGELKSQLDLMNEIENREGVIDLKTQEGVRLENLSRQFSPQVLEAVKTGQIQIDQGVHRAKICAIFIDIVNSTERVVRIDKDKVHKAISMFMEDTIKTLLKYDITVDKFLGDGILAFSNDPIQYSDYVSRTVGAALEIRERISKRQFIYENYWLNELQIRIGIAEGFANVGFYGSEKYFRSYTAIGPVVNLASRICGSASANQILVSHDVMEQLDVENFTWEALGKRTFKGFEEDLIKVYAVTAVKDAKSSVPFDAPECEKCGTVMFLDTTPQGIYTFKCRSCGHVLDENKSMKKAS
jgi:class 3 adenylate cyclase